MLFYINQIKFKAFLLEILNEKGIKSLLLKFWDCLNRKKMRNIK